MDLIGTIEDDEELSIVESDDSEQQVNHLIKFISIDCIYGGRIPSRLNGPNASRELERCHSFQMDSRLRSAVIQMIGMTGI